MTTAPRIGYLGWSGHGNLGDDILFELVQEAIPEADFLRMPMNGRELLESLPRVSLKARRERRLVMGGGTAIGRLNWRLPLQAASLHCSGTRYLLGAGVEDPRFSGKNSFSEGNELRNWVKPLRTFARITVRGPQSAKLLEAVGVEARVIGDPGLYLGRGHERSAQDHLSDRPVAAFSLGYGDDLWGHDHDRVVREVGDTAARMSQAGWTIVFIVMNPSDVQFAEALAARIAPATLRIEHPKTARAFFDAMADVDVMVAERLHAGVLAAAINVPVAMIEYQPKCFDFMGSIDAEACCIRTDRLDSTALDEAIELALSPSQRQRSTQMVGQHQEALGTEISFIQRKLREGRL